MLLLFAVLLVLSLNLVSSADDYSSLTGKVTQQATSLKIYVSLTPVVSIISPKNATYMVNESLLFNYTLSSSADSAWYSIDGLSNVSIANVSSWLYFNISDGSHTIWLYANNSYGVGSANVTFYVNSTRPIIIYKDEYKTNFSGGSTDYYAYTYEEVQALGNIVLENVNYGKIRFDGVIDVLNDRINTDDYVNIENNTHIKYNDAGVDTYELPNFDVPATIWLYNLTFTNPRILRDNAVCPSTICTKEAYSLGILRFKVTGFSNYSAEETPIVVENKTTGGGATGGLKYACDKLANVTANESACKCNLPYIPKGSECCLDNNLNFICDYEEAEVETPLQAEKSDLFRMLAWLFALLSFILLIWLIWLVFFGAGKRKKPVKRWLSRLIGMRVYTENRHFVGVVEEVYVKNSKFIGIAVRVNEKVEKHLERERAFIEMEHLAKIERVIVLDSKRSHYFEMLNVN